ncbi:MAG: hypothetical protein U0939_13645 [Pirellulales bacterium]
MTLINGDSSEIGVPETATIPAGQTAVEFSASAIDDSLLDGLQWIALYAAAAGYDSGPAITAAVTRGNTDISQPLLVTLSSDDGDVP